jgi:phosphoenolpyruvate phosphomutase
VCPAQWREAREEFESFSRAWKGAVPLVIVPNAYPELDASRVKALGNIAMMIYGNYGIRVSVTAMQHAFRRIIAEGGVHNVHRDIVGVEEIFHLQGMDRVKQEEKRFLR